ncbi:MAG TPA: AraC family transcriptional regulator [Bacteroidales bacterium]|nr:AraC family transcriptional regulator [Bacteroidales bacterium]
MLPVFQKIEANINHSFYVEHVKFRYFPNPLQFHPDVEILYVIQGTGTRFVGDSIDKFGPGDVVIIGENIPHVWYSDAKYINGNNDLISEVIFVLFKKEVFGEQFWDMPESKAIYKLIQLSQRGIKLTGETRREVAANMMSICEVKGFKRIILLMSILEAIAEKKEFLILANPVLQNSINHADSERLNRVYEYVVSNHDQKISLKQAASLANLSVPAFCRYFKKRTNKTFIQFLNEIRISFACTHLVEEDQPISKTGYRCGYDNVSFFIKQFKKVTGFTPLGYRKKYSV